MANAIALVALQGGLPQHLVRFVGNGGTNSSNTISSGTSSSGVNARSSNSNGQEIWQIWVEVPSETPAKALRLELAASMHSLYPVGPPSLFGLSLAP